MKILFKQIKDSVPAAMIKEDLIPVSERQEELKDLLLSRPLIHPTMAKRYRKKVENLRKALTEHESG